MTQFLARYSWVPPPWAKSFNRHLVITESHWQIQSFTSKQKIVSRRSKSRALWAAKNSRTKFILDLGALGNNLNTGRSAWHQRAGRSEDCWRRAICDRGLLRIHDYSEQNGAPKECSTSDFRANVGSRTPRGLAGRWIETKELYQLSAFGR